MARNMMGTTRPETVKASGTTPILWDEVQGVDAAKEELVDVAEWLKDPKRFEGLGARAPRGVLLYGPPGTGKTMLARAVASHAGVDFFAASGSSFVEMFVGRGAARIRRLFKDARASDRAVIFIDEIDAIGGERGAGGRRSHQRARAGPEPTSGRARRLRARPRHRDRAGCLQLRGQARQGAAAPGPLRPPGPGLPARPRRPRGDPAHPRQGQGAGRRRRPAGCRAQDHRHDRRAARQRAQRGRDHRRPPGQVRDRPRRHRRGDASPVGRLPAGPPPERQGAEDRRLPRGRPRTLPPPGRSGPARDPQHRPARTRARLRRATRPPRTAT